MGEVSDAVKKCCNILKNSSSDTEKFAALFMVTKLVKGKHATPAAKKAIFESIGFEFLRRLLVTSDVPVDCPPAIYKSVALSIITVFCNEEELATKKELIEYVPIFLDIVKAADDSDNDDNLMAIGEAYNCLKGIAAYPPGQQALTNAGGIDKLSEIYSQGSFQSDEALTIMAVLIAKQGNVNWENKDPRAYHALLNKIAVDFETDQGNRKFEICEVLGALIYNAPRKLILESVNTETWPQCLYKGLSDILQSKIGAAQRNPALMLIANVLEVLGIDWLFTDEDKGKQMFLLLIQLAAIEVRMQLDGKILKSLEPHHNLLTACYLILELSIQYVAADQLDLDQKERQTLYTGLKGAFTAIINLLIKVANDKSKPQGKDKLFVCATIRVLVAWLAQETTAMRAQVYQLLPFILEIANESFYAYREKHAAEKAGRKCEECGTESTIDILRVMLPALCHLAVEDDSRKILLAAKEDQVLFENLEFHWTIVNYKRPPVPRSERLKMLNQPQPELTSEILEDMQDSRAAMVSTCNVLMNLTVLEPKYVEDSSTFNNLLKFIFENLPELKDIPDNLVLHGNLSVLGLLLLKQLSKKVKKNDFSICRYIQATIRFLWDAFTVDESNPTALVVAMTYKQYWIELMELWFLGMQTLAGVITQIPWISEFAIESGWAEGIIQLLKKVKIGTLPPNVKSAYEDFLCHLVDANDSVADVLKKAEALRVCRNHRLMELGKKLFGD